MDRERLAAVESAIKEAEALKEKLADLGLSSESYTVDLAIQGMMLERKKLLDELIKSP